VGEISYDRTSLMRLYERIADLKNGIGWVSKKKIDNTLEEWKREDSLLYSTIRDVMINIENIEKI
jgi:hypothetical protein